MRKLIKEIITTILVLIIISCIIYYIVTLSAPNCTRGDAFISVGFIWLIILIFLAFGIFWYTAADSFGLFDDLYSPNANHQLPKPSEDRNVGNPE